MSPFRSTLIVDDSDSDVFLTRYILNKCDGFGQILEATDGESALDVLRDVAGDSKRSPTLVLLDINMPCVDGFEFLDRLEKLDPPPDVSVIMVSSSDYPKDIERALKSPFVVDYVVKPINMDRAQLITKALRVVRDKV